MEERIGYFVKWENEILSRKKHKESWNSILGFKMSGKKLNYAGFRGFKYRKYIFF